MKDRPELHHLNLPGAPEWLQAVVAIGENASRRGLSAYELEGLCDHMLPGRAVMRETSGRPVVRGSSLHISLSHADGLTALALAPFLVGIDVEWIDPEFDVFEFDLELFGAQDFHLLETCEGDSRRDHFYRLWTLKEANLKLRGRNLLSDPLHNISGAPNTCTAWITRPTGRYCVGVSWQAAASDLSPHPASNTLVDRPVPRQPMATCPRPRDHFEICS